IVGCDAGTSYPTYKSHRTCRPDKAFTPHPAFIVGCDAGASYPTYKSHRTCRPDKAFTPHPAMS
ncbi:hypothetical protein N6N76_10995, partial [Escherichia albertii]